MIRMKTLCALFALPTTSSISLTASRRRLLHIHLKAAERRQVIAPDFSPGKTRNQKEKSRSDDMCKAQPSCRRSATQRNYSNRKPRVKNPRLSTAVLPELNFTTSKSRSMDASSVPPVADRSVVVMVVDRSPIITFSSRLKNRFVRTFPRNQLNQVRPNMRR